MNKFVIGAAALAIAAPAFAQNIRVSFENLLDPQATAFTPVFFGLHTDGYNLFDAGVAVTAGLEEVAEVGSTGTLTSEFTGSGFAIDSATTATGPVTGGELTSVDLDTSAVTGEAFLAFATMVVPTNDLFIGALNPIQLFDSAGQFTGPITIDIFGRMVWDAGTEINNADNGAAFLDGIDGTISPAQNGVAELFFDDPGAGDYLDSLVGRTTAPGFELTSTFTADTAIARITVIPTPGTAALAGLVGLAALRRRR